jgi:hypothetical protein
MYKGVLVVKGSEVWVPCSPRFPYQIGSSKDGSDEREKASN